MVRSGVNELRSPLLRLNDEANLVALDRGLAARLEGDFQKDLAVSKRVTYPEWSRRSPFERMHELLGRVFERQQ